jgi:hypothetical protein
MLTSITPTPRRQGCLLILACTAIYLAACAAPGPQLNSERIEQTFGSYGVEVLLSGGDDRVSSLFSDDGYGKVTRTFAVVRFSGRISSALAREHAAVRSGQSLGAVFKSAGWNIEKHTVFIGELTLSGKHSIVSDLMQIGLPADLASHVYLFVVSKDDDSYTYATIVELHHPDYLSVEDLQSIFGEVILDDSNRTAIDDFVDPALWKSLD